MKNFLKKNRLELAFFAFLLFLWIAWAWILPFNEGPDETMRYQIVNYILEYGKLPTGDQAEIMDYSWGFTYAFRPILPQIAEALFIRIAMNWTKDAFSLIFAGRLVSVVCGLVFAGYVRALSKKLFQESRFQWLFTLLAVCLPGATFLFTYLNCDAMALMASAMILWYLEKGIEDRFSVRTCIGLALSCSLLIHSYYNAYGFLITAILLYLGAFLSQSEAAAAGEEKKKIWKRFWRNGFLILGIVLVLCGWWFARNYILYDGDILGLRTQEACAEEYAMDILKPSKRQNYLNMGYSMAYMLFHSDWVPRVTKSFIGLLGPLWYALRPWMYLGYGLLFGAGLLGVLTEIFEKCISSGKRESSLLAADRIFWHLGMLLAILIPNVLNFWYSYASDYQPQGRYSMPMLVPFMYYITRGLFFWFQRLCAWSREKFKRLLRILVSLVCLWIAGCVLFCVVKIMWPAYRDTKDKAEPKIYTMEEFFGSGEEETGE